MKPAKYLRRALAFGLCMLMLCSNLLMISALANSVSEDATIIEISDSEPAQAADTEELVQEDLSSTEENTISEEDTYLDQSEEPGAEEPGSEESGLEELEAEELESEELQAIEPRVRFEYFSEEVNVLVTLQKEEDLPENAQLVVTPMIIWDDLQKSLEEAIGTEELANGSAAAFDISFLVDGLEVEPGDTVQVQLTLPEFNSVDGASVYHYDETQQAVENMNANTSEEGSVIFDTDHFSTYVIVNNGFKTVHVNIQHYNEMENNKIYADDNKVLTAGAKIGNYKKAINWDVSRVVQLIGDQETPISNPQDMTITSDMSLRVYYKAAKENVNGNATFFDYVVEPTKEAWYSPVENKIYDRWARGRERIEIYAPELSINAPSNYPEGSDPNHRISVGCGVYQTYINGKDINVYTEGTGDNAYKTQIISGTSADYKEVLFNVDEPGLFSMEKKAGKAILEGYTLDFARAGDDYSLTQVKNPEGQVTARAGDMFFPLESATSIGNDKTYGFYHNFFFGMRYDVEFTLGDYVGPLNYSFSGDDDLWVILDGTQVVIDLGGIHDTLTTSVDLWEYLDGSIGTGANTEEGKNKNHHLTILYMERGANRSNCTMNFTLPNAKLIDVSQEMATLTLHKVNTKEESLSGAMFELIDDSDSNRKYMGVSDGDGLVHFWNLPVGTYTLTETMAPDGYTIDQRSRKVVVAHNEYGSAEVNLYEDDGITPVEGNKIVNYTTQDLLNTQLKYSKTATLTDWDKRTYQIQLNATSIGSTSSTTMVPQVVDAMLVFDLSGSMNEGISGGNAPSMVNQGTYYSINSKLDTNAIYYHGNDMRNSPVSGDTLKTGKYPMKYIGGAWKYYNENRWTSVSPMKNIYTWNSRLSTLKEAASSFVDSMAATSANSKVGIATFNGYKEYSAIKTRGILNKTLTTVTNNSTSYLEAINSLYADGGTSPQKGLSIAKEQLDKANDENPKYVILFSDGGPSENTDRIESETVAASLKNAGYTIITVLLNTSAEMVPGTNLTTESWMTGKIASSGYAYTASTADQLKKIFADIQSTITQNNVLTNVQVTDVVDHRFELVNGELERLEEDGAIISVNEDGMTTVTWAGQTIPNQTEGSWDRVINVVAREDFIGGNNITTNEVPGSFISTSSAAVDLPQPKVNVKVRFDAGLTEEVIFLGQKVADYRENMEEITKVAFSEEEIKYGDILLTGVEGNFAYEWYLAAEEGAQGAISLGDGRFGIRSEDNQPLQEDKEAKYYVKVIYHPVPSNDESRYNSTVQGVTYEATSENSYAVGLYEIKVVSGELTITKTFDREYLANIGYTEEQKKSVDARQSVVFTICRYGTADVKCEGEVLNTYKVVISYDGEKGGYTDSATLKGLPAGNYKVQEDNDWSWKYRVTSIKDTYETASDAILFIGRKDKQYATANQFWGETGTKKEIFGYAEVCFTNELKRINWLSDACSAINRFFSN